MAKQKNNTSTKENNEPVALQRRDKENVGERLAATPFTFMRRFSEEMDHLFEDFGFGRGWLTPMFPEHAKFVERLVLIGVLVPMLYWAWRPFYEVVRKSEL